MVRLSSLVDVSYSILYILVDLTFMDYHSVWYAIYLAMTVQIVCCYSELKCILLIHDILIKLKLSLFEELIETLASLVL